MARFIHTADTHLGYRQYHLQEREQDFLDAFIEVIDTAIEEDVDAVIHAGDLFEHSRPDPTTLSHTVQQLQRLADAGIPFLAVVGNHEATADNQWMDIFGQLDLGERLGTEPHIIGDTALYGQDYVTQSRRQSLRYDFQPTDDAEHSLLVAHGLFKPVTTGNWDINDILTESPVVFDGVLLGDDHTPRITNVDGTPVTYPGSTERTDADQRDNRRINIITTDSDDGIEITTRELNSPRTFHYTEIDLSSGQGIEHVRNHIDSLEDIEGVVLIIELDGEGEDVMHGPIEQYGEEAGALEVRVYDRREETLSDAPEMDVQFVNPDNAIDKRLQEMDITPPAADIEREVRRGETARTSMADTIQGRTDMLIEEAPTVFDETVDYADTIETDADEDGEPEAEPSSDNSSEPSEPSQQTQDTSPVDDSDADMDEDVAEKWDETFDGSEDDDGDGAGEDEQVSVDEDGSDEQSDGEEVDVSTTPDSSSEPPEPSGNDDDEDVEQAGIGDYV